MRNICILWLLFFHHFFCSGQIDTFRIKEEDPKYFFDYNDKRGYKCWEFRTNLANGFYFVFNKYDTTRIAFSGTLIDGKREGLFNYYGYGNLFKIEPYRQGKLNGLVKYFDLEGNNTNTESYSDGLANGSFTRYHKYDSISEVTNYVNGIEQGKYLKKNNDGSIEITGQYLNGYKHGKWDIFSFRSSHEINYYDNGVPIGTWTNYSNDCFWNFTKQFNNGIPHGYWEFYNEDIWMHEKGNFKNGMRIGKWIQYDNVKTKFSVDNPLLDCKVKIYKFLYFTNGKLIREKTIDIQNTPKSNPSFNPQLLGKWIQVFPKNNNELPYLQRDYSLGRERHDIQTIFEFKDLKTLVYYDGFFKKEFVSPNDYAIRYNGRKGRYLVYGDTILIENLWPDYKNNWYSFLYKFNGDTFCIQTKGGDQKQFLFIKKDPWELVQNRVDKIMIRSRDYTMRSNIPNFDLILKGNGEFTYFGTRGNLPFGAYAGKLNAEAREYIFKTYSSLLDSLPTVYKSPYHHENDFSVDIFAKDPIIVKYDHYGYQHPELYYLIQFIVNEIAVGKLVAINKVLPMYEPILNVNGNEYQLRRVNCVGLADILSNGKLIDSVSFKIIYRLQSIKFPTQYRTIKVSNSTSSSLDGTKSNKFPKFKQNLQLYKIESDGIVFKLYYNDDSIQYIRLDKAIDLMSMVVQEGKGSE